MLQIHGETHQHSKTILIGMEKKLGQRVKKIMQRRLMIFIIIEISMKLKYRMMVQPLYMIMIQIPLVLIIRMVVQRLILNLLMVQTILIENQDGKMKG